MALSRGDHARVSSGMLINGRYEVRQEIGCGNFSKVYSCRDKQNADVLLALKVLKKEYAHDAKFEHDILKSISGKNADGKEKVLTVLDHFVWNRHPCFILPIKGSTLKSRRLGVAGGHVSASELRGLTKQLLQAMSFLHFDMKLVHTDLKPENILLDHDPADGKGIGSGWTIADFGSASFYRLDRLDSDLISTRPYRAPEVVLGNGWFYPADMWSIGCILFEVYVGTKLFEVNDDHVHLGMMHQRLGPLPPSLTQSAKNSRRFFDARGGFVRPPATKLKPVPEELAQDPLFADLLMQMLAFDPDRRIRADAALQHPFFATSKKSPSPNPKRGDSLPSIVRESPPQPQRSAPVVSTAVRSTATAATALAPSTHAMNTPRIAAPYQKTLAAVAAPPMKIAADAAVSAVPSAAPSSARSTTTTASMDLKRVKCDPSRMPAAGKASGLNYPRYW